MTIPNWLNEDTPCEEEVNIKILDLEYMNEENILVTVLKASPIDYNWETGLYVMDVFFRMNDIFAPNTAQCVDDNANEAIFSCWRHESAGMFQDSPIRRDDISKQLGTLCPAVRRMPELGTIAAELTIAGMEVVKWAFDAVLVYIPVYATGGVEELSALRLDRVTFHVALDSSGSRLIDVEVLIKSLDRAVFLLANSLTKILNLFKNVPGYEYIEEPIIGTTKVAQHLTDQILLTGPFLSQLQNVKTMPTTKMFTSLSAMQAPGLSVPKIVNRMSSIVLGMISSFKFNLRYLKRLLMRLLRKAYPGIMAAILYDSVNDFEHSMLDNVRVQCDGLANIFFTDTPIANTVREGCLIVPDTLLSTLNAIMILLVEYPILSCVCSVQGENTFDKAIEICMQSTFLRAIDTKSTDCVHWRQMILYEGMCVSAFMDSSNRRFETAFDKVFSRIYKFTGALSGVLNIASSLMFSSDEGCDNHVISPYVVTIVPDPIEYFQGCTKTNDCAIKCNDAINDFRSTLNSFQEFNDVPTYSAEESLTVKSSFLYPKTSRKENMYPRLRL